jgi:heat shock protein HtpX
MAGESGGFRQLERVSRRRTLTLVAKLVLLLAEFGLGLDYLFRTVRFSDGGISGFPWFATAIVSVAVALALRANYSGADRVLRAMGAHPISPNQPKNQAVIKVVHEMALAARIPTPRISLIDDPSPNAFAIGSDPDHSRICVTQGLVDQMDREELQGVIGHEIAHIRNCDTRLTTMVTAMFGGFGGFSGRLISRMLSRDREFLADASAVEFTHNPSALIRALEQIAKTESPLACATSGTAQLFIVDPFERADSGRSYNEFINEVTRIRSQPDKTDEQRDAEARNFAAHEYPRNTTAHAVSSHPPLRERIARLQALIVTLPQAQGEASQASGLTDDQLKAKFLESAMFVRNAASTDPEVLAKVTQSALLATPGERRPLAENIGGTQIIEGSTSRDPIEQTLYEANLASTGHLRAPRSPTQNRYASTLALLFKRDAGIDSSLPSALGVYPPSPEGIAPPDSAATEELERKALPRMPVPMLASMQPKRAAIQPAAIDRPTGSRGGIYLFWLVIALSAGAIVATFAAR